MSIIMHCQHLLNTATIDIPNDLGACIPHGLNHLFPSATKSYFFVIFCMNDGEEMSVELLRQLDRDTFLVSDR